MLTVLLVIVLGDFPFPMFGKLAEFETIKECREHIAKEAPPTFASANAVHPGTTVDRKRSLIQ